MKIRVNGKLYVCDNALEHIALFKQISDELDKLKLKREVTPVISKKSVTIGSSIIKNNFSSKTAMNTTQNEVNPNNINKQKLTDTLPEGVYPVSSVKREDDINPEYDMVQAHEKIERQTFPEVKKVPRKISRKVTDFEIYNNLKKERGEIPLVDHSILTKEEIMGLKNNPLVFISGTLNHRIETGFYDNCELLKNIPIAAFISGKATSPEKILKEAFKLIKLSKCTNTEIICYEANNEELRKFKDDKLFKAFDAMIGLSEILKEEGYTPLLCLDNDIRQTLQKLEPNYKVTIPIISRVSSKELEGLNPDEDFIVMNSKNDYDELMLTNNTKKYINDSKKIKTPSR